jgi:hypothetical protein
MEKMVRHPSMNAQEESIRTSCREAEKQLMDARTRAESLLIKEQWCRKLEQECGSEIVIHGAGAYLDGIIARRWAKDPQVQQEHQ